ncbi:ATP-binding protein [Sunxiuqinia sp. A32]|uniref:ATP-binding protein n=1 Tax=Sunxiuqinia sp. A32 TaxID=3461496 RepID=UPI00404536E6
MKQEICIPSQLRYLREVENFIHEIIEQYQLPESLRGHFMLTVSESVNNAITHGNNSDSRKNVSITVYDSNNELFIVIEDEGEGFDFKNVPDPTKRRYIKNERGRGLFLIRNLSDEVKFLNNGSKIQIKFKLDSEHKLLLRRD